MKSKNTMPLMLGSVSTLVAAPLAGRWLFDVGYAPTTSLALGVSYGALVGLTIYVLTPRRKTVAESLYEGLTSGAGLEGEMAKRIASDMEAAKAQVARLREASERLPQDGEGRQKVLLLADKADRIIDGFLHDPSDVQRSRTFLDRYLPGAADVSEKLADFLERGGPSERATGLRKQFWGTLDDLSDAFDKQYERNLDDDHLDVEVDMDVLRRMIKMEGI